MPLARPLAVLSLLAFAACSSSPADADSAPVAAAVGPLQDYTLVLLKTGPRRAEVQGADLQKVMGGHMGNIQRLAREKQLLVAGPYGKQKSDVALRGLFVMDTADAQRARELTETDPGVKAGVFAPEYHTIATAAPLRTFIARELAAQDEARQAGKEPSPADGMRGYVIATFENGDAAAEALALHPAVLCFARLDDKRAFVVLDAKDQGAARTLLEPVAAKVGAHRLDEWFASGRVVDLPKLARD